MPSSDEYRSRIQRLKHAGLLKLWAHIKAGSTPDWPSGRAFEYLILRAFELEGALVTWPYYAPAGDEFRAPDERLEEFDGAVYVSTFACLVEAKDHADPVNVEPLAKLRFQLSRRPASIIGCLFSRSGFTNAALILSRFLAPQTILLWSGDDVEYALSRKQMVAGLARKFRYAVERGLPNFRLFEEE
jgi:hypothetical protein